MRAGLSLECTAETFRLVLGTVANEVRLACNGHAAATARLGAVLWHTNFAELPELLGRLHIVDSEKFFHLMFGSSSMSEHLKSSHTQCRSTHKQARQ